MLAGVEAIQDICHALPLHVAEDDPAFFADVAIGIQSQQLGRTLRAVTPPWNGIAYLSRYAAAFSHQWRQCMRAAALEENPAFRQVGIGLVE